VFGPFDIPVFGDMHRHAERMNLHAGDNLFNAGRLYKTVII
jgi:hypothetical protein